MRQHLIDLAYFNGPLSPYLNALWFRAFGVSLSTIIFCNLAILAITTAGIYRLFVNACDRLTATVSCVIFLSVFGFGQLVETGNYNFVTPYSHELTHGIALSVGMMLCVCTYSRRRQSWVASLAGVLLGLVFLTKAEVFLATAASGIAAALLLYCSEPDRRRDTLKAVSIAGASSLVPIALFALFLSQHMSASDSWTRILGTWTSLAGSDVSSNIFYRRNLGLDEPVTRTWMAVRAFVSILLLGLAAIAADLLTRVSRKAITVAVGLTLFVLSCLVKQTTDPWLDSIWLPVPWMMLGAALPLVALAGCVHSLVRIRAKPSKPEKVLPFAMWAAFGFVLLGKIILTARVYHYGFALAMPAALVLIAFALYFVPRTLRRHHGEGFVFRRFALAMLLADSLFFAKVSTGYYGAKTVAVDNGGDTILSAGARAETINEVLAHLETRLPGDATMMVLPEGVMLNYLSRHPNPTPFTNFMPPELAIFGEAGMLDAIQRHPPDYILMVPKDTSEYGVAAFGTDPKYGMQMMQWVSTHYSQIHEVGSEPFSVRILRRDARSSGAN